MPLWYSTVNTVGKVLVEWSRNFVWLQVVYLGSDFNQTVNFCYCKVW